MGILSNQGYGNFIWGSRLKVNRFFGAGGASPSNRFFFFFLSFDGLIWGSIKTHTNLTPTPGARPVNQGNFLISFLHYQSTDMHDSQVLHPRSGLTRCSEFIPVTSALPLAAPSGGSIDAIEDKTISDEA